MNVTFNIVQNTKINTDVFTFKNPETVTYPVAPLISAKLFTPVGGVLTLKIRATLYINSDDAAPPTINIPTEDGTILTLIYSYDFSEVTPESCDVWYVEVDYSSETVGKINKIESFMKDVDPETSRGTSTVLP
jgi:hypothetical protein|tara:strand:- start:184 stop:582 length:399 start_codon:yes stop_codon:yes gene_type:complete